MYKTIKKVRIFHAFCKVNDVLNAWNNPFIHLIYYLFFSSLILVFYKKNID